MADLVPADSPPVLDTQPRGSMLAPLTDPAGGPALTRLGAFARQGPVRRMLPAFLAVSALGGAALAWSALAPSAQRTLYAQLGDGERATVVEALDKAAIAYTIDNQTGALSVGEGDFYRARMLVASDGALSTPEGGDALLDKLPLGASRTIEGQRLRSAKERDLTLTIMEIDGVESVRVHLAEAEKSVFVRENLPPSASVMVRLARGRQLGNSQVAAIVNLVAGSVPGLSPDAVKVVDQHGRLLSDKSGPEADRLELQTRMEEKLRGQLDTLLAPMLGQGNYTSEIQVELDMDQVTSARESYDKNGGAIRSETQQASQATAPAQAAGVPGMLSNTPPPAATAVPGAPQGTPAPTASGTPPVNGESSSTRTYELGREVSVANATPGKLKRLSVAVAVSSGAKATKPADLAQIKALVSAAVGADPQRGDQVAVVARRFEPIADDALPFWETGWFATLVRYGAALLAVLMVLLLGVRPLIKALRRDPAPAPALAPPAQGTDGETDDDAEALAALAEPSSRPPDPELLSRQVGLAQRIVAEKPGSAVAALRQMLAEPQPEPAR